MNERNESKEGVERRNVLSGEEMVLGSLICANKILVDCPIPITVRIPFVIPS